MNNITSLLVIDQFKQTLDIFPDLHVNRFVMRLYICEHVVREEANCFHIMHKGKHKPRKLDIPCFCYFLNLTSGLEDKLLHELDKEL